MAKRDVILRIGLIAAVVLSAPATYGQTKHPPKRPAKSSAEHLYYDISDDSQSLKLVAISDSGQTGALANIDVIDVTRSPNMLLANTWRIDCSSERMSIVQTTRVAPGSPVEQADVTTAPINSRSSPQSWRVAQLACTGKGDLVERRTHRGDLSAIAQRFWVP